MHTVSKSKDDAERCRIARGFASLQDWRNKNRRGVKEFRSRMHKKGEDRERLQSLINILESEFETYLRPWTTQK